MTGWTEGRLRRFQSSPVPKDGCNNIFMRNSWLPSKVSILTRPEGRVQPTSRPRCKSLTGFQSSPVPKDGCNVASPVAGVVCESVSILTRPEGRVQRRRAHRLPMVRQCFNPHPSRRTGATCAKLDDTLSLLRFQSSPVPKDGCNFNRALCDATHIEFQSSPVPKDGCNVARRLRRFCPRRVSILTRPEGRVQLPLRIRARRMRSAFQSSPVPKDGCNCCCAKEVGRAASFNPHPSRRTGATEISTLRWYLSLVSILTRPEGRVQLVMASVALPKSEVSILTRPEGRVQPCAQRPRAVLQACFNPHPSRRTGATPTDIWLRLADDEFQSSPVPKDGCNWHA